MRPSFCDQLSREQAPVGPAPAGGQRRPRRRGPGPAHGPAAPATGPARARAGGAAAAGAAAGAWTGWFQAHDGGAWEQMCAGATLSECSRRLLAATRGRAAARRFMTRGGRHPEDVLGQYERAQRR
jgi:hypothetical protein